MNNDLLSAFLEWELNDSARIVLASAVRESMQSEDRATIKSFEFNCFDVVLDFELRQATLEDVLSTGAGSVQRIPLPLFLKACGLS